jgi:hypothetical protein
VADLFAQFGVEASTNPAANTGQEDVKLNPAPRVAEDSPTPDLAPPTTQDAPVAATPDAQPAPAPEVKAPTPTEAQPSADASGGVDLFAQNGITPPSITEKNRMALSRIAPVGPIGTVGTTVVTAGTTAPEEQAQLERLAASRFTPQQIADFKAHPIGWSEAVNYLDYSQVLPAGGVYQGVETLRAANAAAKMERGEDITDGEKDLLYGIIDKQLEMSLRGFTVGGGIKYYGLQMPAFAAEFIATGGVGKLAQQAAVKGTEKLAIKGMESAVLQSAGNIAVKGVGVTANVAARTVAMPDLYLPQYGERRLNDEIAITDKGELLLKQSQESPAKSALMAFAYSAANVGSEMSGEALGAGAKALGNTGVGQKVIAAVKTPLIYGINQIPAPILEGLYNAYKMIKPTAKVSEVFTAAGWHGMLNELGENRVQDVLNATIGLGDDQKGPKTFDEYLNAITPSKDQLLIESGIIAIAGGLRTSADLSLNIMRAHGVPENEARDMVNTMTATEQEAFNSKYLQTPRGTLPADLPSSPETKALLDETPTAKQAMADGEVVPSNFEEEVADSQLKAAEAQDPPRIDNSESIYNKLHREWVNELEPIQSLPAAARARGKQVPVSEDTKLLSTAYAGTVGAIRQTLQVATFAKDAKGNNVITGKGFKPILDDFSNKMMPIEPDIAKRQADFNDYLVARRYTEDLSNREDVEVSEAQKLKSVEDLSRLAAKYGQDFRWFETFGQEIYDFQRRVLQNLVTSGVMGVDSFDKILKENPHYIPFDRVLPEEEFGGSVSTNGVFTKANANRIVKTIKGSEAEVKNVFNTVIRNTAKILDMARRNEVAQSIAGLADVMPEYIQKVATPMAKMGEVTKEDGTQQAIFRPSQHQPKGTIIVRREGKKEYYEVSKPILQAVESIGASQLNFIERIFQASASLLRAGATLVPEFWVRNVLRDQQIALLQSGVHYRPTDFAKGLWAVLGKSELYNEWERSGGSFNSYMELDDKGLQNAYKELLYNDDGLLMKAAKGLVKLPAHISEALEQATRVGVFHRAKEAGQSSIEAAYTSREATLNFSRRGSEGKRLNRVIPFFNAGIQGSDKLIRTFKENPQAAVFWGLATITLPSVALAGYYLYGAPDDERKEYLEIPQWQRDMFWVAKVGGEWHRYPKPFAYGYLFGSMPERMMQWMFNRDKPQGQTAWLETLYGLAGSVSPINDPTSLLPPLVKTAIENVTNYNFFTGRQLYPDWMERLDPEKRANKYTSDTARLIGEKLGVSPAKVDNALRGQLAGSAEYATNAGDWILKQVKEWNGQTVPQKPLSQSDIPLIKAFAVRNPSGYRSQSAQDFFDNLKNVEQRHATFKSLEGSEQKDYLKRHARELDLYSTMTSRYKEMKSIQDEIDIVYEDKKMSGDRKAARITKLEDQITRIARDANRNYNLLLKGTPK